MGNRLSIVETNNRTCRSKIERLMAENNSYLENHEMLIKEIKDLKNQLETENHSKQEAKTSGINRDIIRCSVTTADVNEYKNLLIQKRKEIVKLQEELALEKRKVKNFNDHIFKETDSIELSNNILLIYYVNSINEIIPSLKISLNGIIEKKEIIDSVIEHINDSIVGVSVDTKCSLYQFENESTETFIVMIYYYLFDYFMSISSFIEN